MSAPFAYKGLRLYNKIVMSERSFDQILRPLQRERLLGARLLDRRLPLSPAIARAESPDALLTSAPVLAGLRIANHDFLILDLSDLPQGEDRRRTLVYGHEIGRFLARYMLIGSEFDGDPAGKGYKGLRVPGVDGDAAHCGPVTIGSDVRSRQRFAIASDMPAEAATLHPRIQGVKVVPAQGAEVELYVPNPDHHVAIPTGRSW